MLGTACSTSATKVMMLGCGELGKEVVIELQRLGVEVIGVDRYANAPAMQVAHRAYVVNMLDGAALRALIETEKPDLIVPEIEAIATDMLAELETEGFNIIPSAKATQLTMNREGIRRLAAETLAIPTSPYIFAATYDAFCDAITEIGLPCVVKPIMSSSGKGQSLVKTSEDIEQAWQYAQEGGRAGQGKVIVEGFVDFDYEITLLTIQASDGIHYCQPIGHRQEDGDYRESWQPAAMSVQAIAQAQLVAKKVVNALGGYGLFGVELFVKGDEVIFSEVSPRPHDTGLVTLISQDLSEFALHARAILGLPIYSIEQYGPSASAVILREGESNNIRYTGLDNALAQPQTQIRLFGKPEIKGRRRLGVVLKRSDAIELAIEQAVKTAAKIDVHF
ncbi:formate-dependent phosphoribosylglycinamide formyltransferase [Algibacillus agarilyticus]|uniref:formate-dependent phosphoribosylglycinamide formyltransferase n=1 Tax=Algibacillus agarilyticus TaxID=2234133 RepID=UPI000DCFDED3|nr:formate-dependent phosphoribosylglycinamide formyltransferase [Algibacillus agarilyticus]